MHAPLQKFCNGGVPCSRVLICQYSEATMSYVRQEVLRIGALNHDHIPHPVSIFVSCILDFRPDILDLHERFLAGGNWGLERTFDSWVRRQSWRKVLPTSFLECLGIVRTDLRTPRFEVPAPRTQDRVRPLQPRLRRFIVELRTHEARPCSSTACHRMRLYLQSTISRRSCFMRYSVER